MNTETATSKTSTHREALGLSRKDWTKLVERTMKDVNKALKIRNKAIRALNIGTVKELPGADRESHRLQAEYTLTKMEIAALSVVPLKVIDAIVREELLFDSALEKL